MLGYDRCPGDDSKASSSIVGVNPETGQTIELNIHGTAAAQTIRAAIMSVSSAMKTGVEEDFLSKIALAVAPQIESDPHSLCPMLTIFGHLLVMSIGAAEIGFTDDGLLQIRLKGSDPADGYDKTCPLEEFDPNDEDEEDESAPDFTPDDPNNTEGDNNGGTTTSTDDEPPESDGID